jgi:integrase/recombinase XerD
VSKMAALRVQAKIYKQSAFAVSSQKTYRCQLKCFLQFCLDHECMPMPCAQETLICYTAFLAKKMLPGTISNYLNVVRIMHVEAGFANPLDGNFELTMLKRGINRVKGVPPNQKMPITLEILQKIYSGVDQSVPSELAFWATCLLGFFGFLRKSTLLPASPSFCVGKILTRGDIVDMSFDSFTLLVRNSKVIQFGQKFLSLPYFRSSNHRLCPIRAVLAHFGASPLPQNRPLFNYLKGGVEVFYSHAAFIGRLKQGLVSAGVDHTQYSAHSLRRGGASFAYEIGLSPLQIKQRGDWASSAYERYVFVSKNSLDQVAMALSNGTRC